MARSKEITPLNNQIVIYGTSWCGMTQTVRRYFDRMDIPYEYIDLEDSPEAVKELRWITGGYTNHPTVLINGQTLVEPTISELEIALEKSGYI